METLCKISRKGWVVIPIEIRKKFRLTYGSTLRIKVEGDRIVLIPEHTDPIEECYGKLRSDESLTDLLLKERRKDFPFNERKIRS